MSSIVLLLVIIIAVIVFLAFFKEKTMSNSDSWTPEEISRSNERQRELNEKVEREVKNNINVSTEKEARILDSLEEQRMLSEKDLMIFNAELQRRSKSVVLTYVLWFFLGGFGIHNFYMGKIVWGIANLALANLAWFFLIESASQSTNTLTLGILSLGSLTLILLWDLFTIPGQLAQREECVKRGLLNKLRIKVSQ